MPSSARDYPNLFRGSGYYQPGQVVSNGYNSFRVTQSPGRTKSGAVKVGFKQLPKQEAAPAPAAAPPPPAPPAPAAPAPKPAPKPTQNTQFSDAAAALLKSAEASLAAINKPAEKMKILQTGSIDVGAAPLQIGPAAPPPKTSGVDSFKRRKPASNPMKILTQNSLNI